MTVWYAILNLHNCLIPRVQEGVCYHLYTRARERLLDDYPLPEIQRTRLEEIILHIKILKLGSVRPFLSKIMMPPDSSVVEISLQVIISFYLIFLFIIFPLIYFDLFPPSHYNILFTYLI